MYRSLMLVLFGGLWAAAMAAGPTTTRPATRPAPAVSAGSQPASRPVDPRRAALLAKAREARRQWELRRYDTNKDGKLDEAERRQMLGDRRKQYAVDAEVRERFDTDGDGKLSPAERRAMDTVRRAARDKVFVEMWDTNGDGTVDDRERKVADAYYRSRLTQRRQVSDLRRWDRNRDGVLDERERATMEADQRNDLRIRRRQRQDPTRSRRR